MPDNPRPTCAACRQPIQRGERHTGGPMPMHSSFLICLENLSWLIACLEWQRDTWEAACAAQCLKTARAAVLRMAPDDPLRILLETPVEEL